MGWLLEARSAPRNARPHSDSWEEVGVVGDEEAAADGIVARASGLIGGRVGDGDLAPALVGVQLFRRYMEA